MNEKFTNKVIRQNNKRRELSLQELTFGIGLNGQLQAALKKLAQVLDEYEDEIGRLVIESRRIKCLEKENNRLEDIIHTISHSSNPETISGLCIDALSKRNDCGSEDF